MSIFKEIPPTAGWPIYAKDLLGVINFSGNKPTLEQDFMSYLGLDYAQITSSGTSALYIILEAIKNISSKKVVVIPSYVCPLVVLAIHKAGLETEVCDIAPNSFSFNLSDLKAICSKGNVLAVIPVHLAGIPVDLDPVLEIASEDQVFVIEDCAQSLGARYKTRPVGTFGDASFFSLCRGKGLTIYEGGVIAVKNKQIKQALGQVLRKFNKPNFCEEFLKITEIFGYWLLYRPQTFWFIFKMPQFFWKALGREFKAALEEYDPDFPVHSASVFRKSVGQGAFHRLDEQLESQAEKAKLYIQNLSGLGHLEILQPLPGTLASWPYLTLVFDTPQRKNTLLQSLNKQGLGASQVYALPITDYPFLKTMVPQREFPAARYLSERALSLSTSIFLNSRTILAITKEVARICA